MILGLDAPTARPRHRRRAGPTRRCPPRCATVGSLLDAGPCTPAAAPATTCAGWRPRTASRAAGSTRCSTGRPGGGGRPAHGRASRSGMGQRLGIAAALLGDPEVLLLDEPVNGLDTEGIRWVRDLLRRLAAEGRTVFLSSHLMSEMQLTADHLIVIGRGRLLADTSMDGVHRPPLAARHAGADTRCRSAVPRPDPRRAPRSRPTAAGGWDVAGMTRRDDRRAGRRGGDRAARADPPAVLAGGRVHGHDRVQRRVPRRHR